MSAKFKPSKIQEFDLSKENNIIAIEYSLKMKQDKNEIMKQQRASHREGEEGDASKESNKWLW